MKIEFNVSTIAWSLFVIASFLLSLGFGLAGGAIAFIITAGLMTLIASLIYALVHSGL